MPPTELVFMSLLLTGSELNCLEFVSHLPGMVPDIHRVPNSKFTVPVEAPAHYRPITQQRACVAPSRSERDWIAPCDRDSSPSSYGLRDL